MSFGSDVTRFNRKASSNMDVVVRRATFELSKMLVFKTAVGDPTYWKFPAPPGYTGGTLRSNWHIGQDQAPTGILPNTGTSPAIAQAMTLNAGHVAYLVNNLPYAMAIMEFGHSRQTPTAAARASVMQIQGMVSTFCNGLA